MVEEEIPIQPTHPHDHHHHHSFLASLDMAPTAAEPSSTTAPEPSAAAAGGTQRQRMAAAEAIRAAVVEMCMGMHLGVRQLAQEFYRWVGRRCGSGWLGFSVARLGLDWLAWLMLVG